MTNKKSLTLSTFSQKSFNVSTKTSKPISLISNSQKSFSFIIDNYKLGRYLFEFDDMLLSQVDSLTLGEMDFANSYVPENYFYLKDTFSTPRIAGTINGSSVDGVGGVRTVVDANLKMSISGGQWVQQSGTVSASEGLWYPIQTRKYGSILSTECTPTVAVGQNGEYYGWDDALGSGVYDVIAFRASGVLTINRAGAGLVSIGSYVSGTTYQCLLITRSVGQFYFIKGGIYTYWTLIAVSTIGSVNLYPTLRPIGVLGAISSNHFISPKWKFMPTPLDSDGMSLSLLTDGLGNIEGNGRVGTLYNDIGTWGVSSGKRSCSVLSGGIGYSYLSSTSSNVLIEAICTRTAGASGIVARYVDNNNLLRAYYDGTNIKLDKVVAGVVTNLLSATATYSATAITSLLLDGTTAKLSYNGTPIGNPANTVATIPSSTSFNHGLYTNDVNATFDNLVIWGRGNSENIYSELDNYPIT